MNLIQASKDEIIIAFNSLFQAINKPIFIVNQDYKIVLSNDAFHNYTLKSELEIAFFDFGNALGCSYLSKDTKSCGKNYYCELCSLRNVINECLKKEKGYSSGDFVRDFNLNDEIIFRHIIFDAFQLKLRGEKFVVLIINKSETDINANELKM